MLYLIAIIASLTDCTYDGAIGENTSRSNGWSLTIISDLREGPWRGLDSALFSRPLGCFRRHNRGVRSHISHSFAAYARNVIWNRDINFVTARPCDRATPTYLHAVPQIVTIRRPGLWGTGSCDRTRGGPVHPSIPGSFAREPRRGIVVVSVVKEGVRVHLHRSSNFIEERS